MVDATGIEPVTPSMSTRCSPAELRVRAMGSPVRPGAGKRGYNGTAVRAQALRAKMIQAAIIRSTSETISRR